MQDDFDRVADSQALKNFAQSAEFAAHSIRRLQSAFAVYGYELREVIDVHPENILRETTAKEIGAATVARAARWPSK